jgi:flagellar protein FlaI
MVNIQALLGKAGGIFNGLPLFGRSTSPETAEETLFPLASFSSPLPPDAEPIGSNSSYLLPNGVRVNIGLRKAVGEALYFIQEPELTELERRAYQRLMYRLTYELHLEAGKGPEAYTPEALEQLVEEAAREVSIQYGAADIHELTQEKLMYYVKRDLIGYGPVDPLLNDNDIEDIKVSGYHVPFIIIHREYAQYGWLTTNIALDPDSQDSLGRRLVQMGGSTLSIAFPAVECMLPNGDRLSVFYQYEVSPHGTSVSIRRHKREPYTVVQFIEHGELSPLMAACLWQLLEAKGVLFIVGQPGAGKTALVNALGIMIRDSLVPVTIEDFPELNLPQKFKQSLVTRYSKALRTEAIRRGEQVGEFNQEDLLRSSLRIRPDYLIVGEILTKEAPVFLQAINIGLSGFTSFHADSIDTTIARLTEKTIGVDPTMLHLIDWVITVSYLKHEETGSMVRRIRSVDEILSVGNYNNVFKWIPPPSDLFEPSSADEVVDRSSSLGKIMVRRGISKATLVAEIEEKRLFLEDLQAKGVRKFAEVSEAFRRFYASKVAAPIPLPTATVGSGPRPSSSKEDELWRALQSSSRRSGEEAEPSTVASSQLEGES